MPFRQVTQVGVPHPNRVPGVKEASYAARTEALGDGTLVWGLRPQCLRPEPDEHTVPLRLAAILRLNGISLIPMGSRLKSPSGPHMDSPGGCSETTSVESLHFPSVVSPWVQRARRRSEATPVDSPRFRLKFLRSR